MLAYEALYMTDCHSKVLPSTNLQMRFLKCLSSLRVVLDRRGVVIRRIRSIPHATSCSMLRISSAGGPRRKIGRSTPRATGESDGTHAAQVAALAVLLGTVQVTVLAG